MALFIQQVLNGIMLGSVYSLVALGLTLEYGILHIPNFAHGALYMAGAYFTFLLATNVGLNFWLAMIIAMAVLALIGVLVERIVYRPLMLESPLSSFIAAIGLIFIFVDGALNIFGPDFKRFPPIHTDVFQFFGVTITLQRIIIVVVTAVLIILLHLFIKKTTVGATIEATAQDREGAQLMGISVNRVRMIVFALGTALASAAAALVAPIHLVYPGMGGPVILKAFVIIILGGMGSIPGAIIGGFMLGVVESLSGGYISTSYNEVFAFGVLVTVLAIRPTGLFGGK
ncbi:MAG: branched-chain amino acid ABC transporter permease [Deltaproteobacteria bacterium]|jgi:branched-chain amino acid transport system permease protein|nr:branched-chain amino acid ABC transporter permease [Deltaproteobacteria bacterium]